MSEKKLIKSPVVIALYVIAALVLVYCFYLIGSTVSYINSYYSSYSMSPQAGEIITYVLQSVYQPLIGAVLLAVAGYILNEVRALNPAYYATEEEIAAAKAAKAAAKEAAKAEKAAKEATVEVETTETEVTEEEIEAEADEKPEE